LRFFDLIVPCGITGRLATSLEKILARRVDRSEVIPRIVSHFADVFGLEMKWSSQDGLFESLERFEESAAVPA
jgi:lipoate-protein ligase B